MAGEGESQRLDKWLWYARFFKTRSLATRVCTKGRIRINGKVVRKAHHGVRPGDVLTFPQGHDIRVVRVLDPGARRGPAPEAQALYDDLEPPQTLKGPGKKAEKEATAGPPARRERGQGRPTKRERRDTDKFKGRG